MLFEFGSEGQLSNVILEMNTPVLHRELMATQLLELLTLSEEEAETQVYTYGPNIETAYLLALRVLDREIGSAKFNVPASILSLIKAAKEGRPVDLKEDLVFEPSQ